MDIIQGMRALYISSPDRSLQQIEYAISAYHLYNSYDPYLRPIRSALSTLQSRTYTLLFPYLNRALLLLQSSPNLISVGLLVLFLLIALQILNFVRRIMMWWIRVMWWVTVVSVLALVVSAVWQRGPERVGREVWEWGNHLSDVWWREYRRWDGYQKQQQYSQQKMRTGNGRASWR